MQSITQHEGKKYLRKIYSAVKDEEDSFRPCFDIDVYCVLEAFGVTCPATQHAIKKLLCCGNRGKGTKKEDLQGALAAICRAIELDNVREE